ncbi:MAG: hypothetical protein R6W70_07840 [bacterium]
MTILTSIAIYTVLSYLFYIVFYLFIQGQVSEAGMFLFTPTIILCCVKVLSIKGKQLQKLSLFIFMTIPWGISTYLTFIEAQYTGWEITGFMPVPVLSSFLFAPSGRNKSPLLIKTLPVKTAVFLVFIITAGIVHLIIKGNFINTLQFVQSLYAPAIILAVIASFVLFLFRAAAGGILVNSFDFFISEGKIDRVVFLNDKAFGKEQLNIVDMVLAEDIDEKTFSEKVSVLDKEAVRRNRSGRELSSEQYFSVEKDGIFYEMAPLKKFLSKKKDEYVCKGLKIPEKLTADSYVALAEDRKIKGYYVMEKSGKDAEKKMLKYLKKEFSVNPVIITDDKKSWKGVAEIYSSVSDIEISETDFLITDDEIDLPETAMKAGWGAVDKEKYGIYFLRESLLEVVKLMKTIQLSLKKINRVCVIAGLPFILSFAAGLFDIYVAQLSAVTILFSVAVTLFYLFSDFAGR